MRKRLFGLVARLRRGARSAKRAALLASALTMGAAVLGAPADLARGLAWLQAQVQAQGALALESQAAARQQARCETATTLLKLAGSSTQVAGLIASLQESLSDAATESLACWQQLRQQLGQTILVGDLEARRVSQQGYAPYEGFAVASALDTGWALAAQLRNLSTADKGTLLSWLQSAQAPSGSFTTAGREDVLATAAVLRGLKDEASKSAAAAAIAGKAATWLLSQRSAQGNWLDDVAFTAIVYEAAHPYTGLDASIGSGVEAYLLSRQQPDGSWQADPYVTAVALRALALTSVAPIDPTLAAAATVRGVVTLAATGEPVAGATLSAQPATGTVRSTVTDAHGRYLMQGITPGAITLTASSGSYQTLTAQVTVPMGGMAVFSPALYPTGATPPAAARIKGRVLAFGSNTALAGTSVQVTGATQASALTDTEGAFDIAVSAGTHTVSYSLAGYASEYQQVSLSGGSTADVGTVLLRAARATSSMRGVVSDVQGVPLAGATVALQSGRTAVTNSGGAYSFADLSGLQFAGQVSASGYATRSFSLSITQPGDVVQDFSLPSLNVAYLNLSDLTLSSPSAGLRKDITATAVVSNPSSGEATAGATAFLVDPQGTRIASLVATDSSGHVLPALILQPGQQQQIHFKWNTGNFAPGSYLFNARLQVPDTASRDNPDGIVLASLQRPLSIAPGSSFFGSVTANPPVLRAGTNTPVKLSALIQNDGNVALPAQDYRLTMVNTSTGQATYTQAVSSEELAVTQLRNLSFTDWTPASGGNFRVELTAASTPGALVTTTLYVGDAGSAGFTVDKSFVPAGTQVVRGSVKVTGQSLANGTVNDPLVPLVKQAIATAVQKADTLAYDHYANPSAAIGQCFMCHVQTQAVVGGERSLKYTAPVNALRRSVLMSAVTQNIINETATSMTSVGALTEAAPVGYRDGPTLLRNTNTTLGLWAASQWHDPAAVSYSKVRMANYLMKAQLSDGSWAMDHESSWWRTRAPLAALNAGSLSSLRDALQTQPVPRGKKLTPFVVPGLPAGDKRMTVGADGTLYVTLFGGQVWAVSPSGTATVLVNTINARSAWPLSDGRLVIGSDSGVYIRQTNGTLTRLWIQNVFDAQPMANGNFLVTLWGGNRLYTLTPAGVPSEMTAGDSRLTGTMGATIMPEGSIIAYGQNQLSILRYSATGQLRDLPIPVVPPGGLMNSNPYKDGLLLSTQIGLFFYNKDWVAERWTHERVFGSATLSDGRLLVNYNGGLYVVEDNPVDVPANLLKIDTSMNKVANWLKAGVGIDNNNNIDVAFRLMGLAHARNYFRGTARATEFDSLIQSIGTTLRSRQRSDGGWFWRETGFSVTDSMVTAMAGIALDALNPSPDSPEVRKAIQLLLGRQKADGTWPTENGIVAATATLVATTWVEIWLPIMLERLGGIDTDLSVTFPSNVVMSNPDRTPTSTVTAADGSSTRVWKLIGVTEATQQVNFDLTLQNMQVDEVRPVAQQASLVFGNSFVAGSVTAAIEVPTVAVTTNLTHNVRTDKPSYTEADQAVFTAAVFNAGTADRTAQVRFSVLDGVGQLVRTLALPAAVSVPSATTATSSVSWPVAGILSSAYQVRAELLSPTGLVYGSATASFTVTASQQTADSTRILTDRVSYSAAQSVQLTSRAANLTTNVVQENLSAVTVVRSAGGQQVFSQTEAIAQLAPGGQRQYSYGIAASGLAVGNYTASLQLLNAQGSVLSQTSATFSVLGADQTGVGLTGQLQAMPSVVLIGQSVALNLSATNNGNTALANVPVTVRVVEPTVGVVVASFAGSVPSWAQAATQTFAWSWPAQGLDGQTLVAAASANVGGRDVSLGQANIRLVGVPQLKADPAQLDFPLIYVGESTAALTSTVSSIGSAAASGVTLSLAGANASQFVIPEGGCTQSASLPIGASCTLTISYRPTQAGTHAAQARIGYANGAELAVQLTGQAKPIVLTGSVAPEPGEVAIGQPTSLAWSVSNPAGVSVTAQVTLSLVNGSGQSVASWPVDPTVAANATTAGNQSYTPDIPPQTLAVVLSQSVAGSNTILATSTLVVTEIPVKVDPTAGIRREARILVLVSCPQGQGDKGDKSDKGDKGFYGDGSSKQANSTQDGKDKDHDAKDGDDKGSAGQAACVSLRTEGIASYLTSLGITHKVVSTQEDFKRELCCGTYNTYWISGGAAKLNTELVSQLREAIWAGESLLTDGVHDARNQLLHPVNGIVHRGKLPTANQSITIAEGAIYAPGTLPTLGQPLKAELLPKAKAQAWFAQKPGKHNAAGIASSGDGRGEDHQDGDEHEGSTQAATPAIVSHRYGQGSSLLFAFDLAGMLTADPQASAAPLRGVMQVTASHSANGTQTVTIGDLVALAMSVTNQGTRTAAVQIKAALPAGISHHSANITPTTVEQQGGNAGTVTWTIGLGSLQTRELIWRVLAKEAGTFELPVAFWSVPQRPGERARLLDTRSFTLSVRQPTQLVNDAPAKVQALQPSASNDKTNRTKALDAATQAASLHAQGKYALSIAKWLAAADALIGIASADTTAARDAVARALEASTDALCQASAP